MADGRPYARVHSCTACAKASRVHGEAQLPHIVGETTVRRVGECAHEQLPHELNLFDGFTSRPGEYVDNRLGEPLPPELSAYSRGAHEPLPVAHGQLPLHGGDGQQLRKGDRGRPAHTQYLHRFRRHARHQPTQEPRSTSTTTCCTTPSTTYAAQVQC